MLKASREAPAGRLRPEAELLLCCARIATEAERASRIHALLAEDLDWAYLLPTARAHGMMPLLYWHLEAACPDAVPQATMDELRERFQDNARCNLRLTRELLGLLALLESRGIPAVPYKGPALAASLYGNLALRQFRDLDILVHREDVPGAREALVSQGYRREHRLSPLQQELFLRSQCEAIFQHAGGFVVELHWEITPRYFSFPLDVGGLLERAERSPLAGADVPGLSAEDLLLILCVHGSKHRWERLEWICGVARLLQRDHESVNWDRIVERATMLGARRMLFLGLFLAVDLLEAPLPGGVLQEAREDQAVKALAGQSRERLFLDTGGPPKILDESLFHPFHLMMRERMRDRIRHCFRLAMTPTARDWAIAYVPAAFSPLYHVFRPIRLAGKYGKRAVERVAHRRENAR